MQRPKVLHPRKADGKAADYARASAGYPPKEKPTHGPLWDDPGDDLGLRTLRNAIHAGNQVVLNRAEYLAWGRNHLQRIAARYLDLGDPVRAQIALNEVRRLDRLHEFTIGG